MVTVPFVIYADFESFLFKVEGPENISFSLHIYERHVSSSFSFLIVSFDPDRIYEPVVYRGPNVIDEFFKQLKTELDKIALILNNIVSVKLSPKGEQSFSTSEKCYLCGELLGVNRVRDHDHLTGKFRGAALNNAT